MNQYVCCMRWMLPFVLTISALNPVRAQTAPARGTFSLPNTVRHTLVSKINNRRYVIDVSLPVKYDPKATQKRYPTLYLLDGEHQLPKFFSARDGDDLILVGIGYSEYDEPRDWTTPPGDERGHYRSRDYTTPRSTTSPMTAPDSAVWKWSWVGGAPEFLRIIRTEVIPLIEGSYNVSDDRGLHGHSLGGLFVGYTFLTARDAFTRYAMTSPSFWWDAGFIYGVEKNVRTPTSNTPTRVHMSVGQLEGPRMQASMWRLADQLCDAQDKYPRN